MCKSSGSNYTCKCKEKYFGDPYTECKPTQCLTSIDCPRYLQCVENTCINPCKEHSCAANANCLVLDHEPACQCISGYTGDASRLCTRPISPVCNKDSDCPNLLACIDKKCQDACSTLKPCGTGAKCEVFEKGSWVAMSCYCPEGYDGDATDICRTSEYIYCIFS